MTSANKKRIDLSKKKRIALVCSGGAAKAGAFHIGVALGLQEKGFRFLGGYKGDGHIDMEHPNGTISVFVGSSAGAILSTFIAAGYSIDQIFESFLKGKQERITAYPEKLTPLTYLKMFSIRRELRLNFPGFFSTAGIERYLAKEVLKSNRFQDLVPDLFIVATQLNHSKKIVFGKLHRTHVDEDRTAAYLSDTSISEAAAASTALPPIFCPFPITHGKVKTYYFDGEIRDTLSTHVARDAGADLIFASYTHQPYHFKRDIGSLHNYGISTIMIQALYLMIERKIQQYRHNLDRSRAAYDTVFEFLHKEGLPEKKRVALLEELQRVLNYNPNQDIIFIHPKPDDHETFFGDHFNLNPHKLQDTVRAGFKSAVHALRRYDFVS